ncbi:hypothetical protein K443DRAFT_3602 [Laccaria amethystina LaAM-08-1]|uniref:Uncharacterized protein n=1 Tax=Laccaria amethystina LaAM-08-1 TaxID=1095629 RepID=A0A0C9X159_9AGAR|nr:hypothetical protein K443DRAFT_3602 [Laccaria amethystina LaAM-08-1]
MLMITTVPILYHIKDALTEKTTSQLFHLLAEVVPVKAAKGMKKWESYKFKSQAQYPQKFA